MCELMQRLRNITATILAEQEGRLFCYWPKWADYTNYTLVGDNNHE